MEHQTSKVQPPEMIGLSLLSKLGGCCPATADRKVRKAGFEPDAIAVLLNKRVPLWEVSRLPEICRVVFPNVQQTELYKGANANVR